MNTPHYCLSRRFSRLGLGLKSLLTASAPFVVLFLCGSLNSPNVARAADWLQLGGDPQKDNVNYAETALTPSNVSGLKLLWTFTMANPTDAVPVYLSGVTTANGVQDILYVNSKNGDFYALNAETGKLIWSAKAAADFNNSSPCIDPNRQFVYFPGADGFVHKYAVGTGVETTGGGWPEMYSSSAGSKLPGALGWATDASGITWLYGGLSGFGSTPHGGICATNLATGAQHIFNMVCSNLDAHISAPGQPGCGNTGAGVWSRPGFMYDPAVNLIYVATAEFGAFNPAGLRWSQTVVALNPACTNNNGMPVDSFTPTNYQAEINADTDQGSGNGQVMPDLPGCNIAHVVMTLGKDAHMRLHNALNMSGAGAPGHVGGELSDTIVPQGGENFAQPSIYQDPATGTWWEIVPTTKGISGLTYGLDTAKNPTFTPMWSNSSGWCTGCEVANGIVFGAGQGGSIFALDVHTGKTLWSSTTAGRHWAGVAECNGMLYVTANFSSPAIVYGFGLPGGVTPPPPPAAPSNLAATSISSSQINLSWTASTTSGVTYSIFRSTSSSISPSSGAPIATGVTGTTYSDTGLAASATYYYEVEAVNSGGASAPSNEANATTMAAASCSTAPSAPTGLTATAASSTQINLSWTASTAGPGCTITYNVYSSETSGFTPSSSNQIATGVSGTSFSSSGLTASTTYYYVVEAVDSVGSSSPSNQASATTEAGSTQFIAINCGGPAEGSFAADEDFAGGAKIDHANTINTSKVSTHPAPAAVYQSARIATATATPFTYTIGGLTPGSSHSIQLYFCETYFKTTGSRVFNVSINGDQVLTKFDIVAASGGENIANLQMFTAPANASGQYVITFTSTTNNALISGIEIDN